jgi:hypothetical protein
MNRIRTVAVFPTVFTLANLSCGFFAIVVVARVERPISLEPAAAVDKIVFTNPTRVMRQLDPTNDTHNIMLGGWLIFLATATWPGWPARRAISAHSWTACAIWCRSGWLPVSCW